MNLLADATLPGLQQAFPFPFKLTLYQNASDIPSLLANQDALLCRSTLKVDATLIQKSSLQLVATASSGTDHIDVTLLKKKGITLFDAKGSNAKAVGDYVLSSIAHLQTQHLLTGRKVGIIGLGSVGTELKERLEALDFDLVLYDPPKQKRDSSFLSASFNDLIHCDLICVHANLHYNLPHPSYHLLNEAFLSQLKPHTAIINAARGGIVDENALQKITQKLYYCTDVFLNEPDISPLVVRLATLCTPHVAGHSIEAKYNAVRLISQKIHDRLHLPYPVYQCPTKDNLSHKSTLTWQKRCLSLYNPIHETQALKTAVDKKATFLQLRVAHQHRHDFPF